MNRAQLNAAMGIAPRGVVYGLEAPVPGSGLTLTYTEGLVRVGAAASTNPKGFAEKRVAGSTLVATASKDTYVYLDSAGAVQQTNVALGGVKPLQSAIGELSEWLFKLVTDGSDITSVEDLRRQAGIDLVILPVPVSFEATEVGDSYVYPGFRGRIVAVDGIVANALGATDAGSVTPKIKTNGAAAAAVTNGVLSFALSAAIGVRDLEVPSAANVFGPFDGIILTSAKTTAGGYAFVNLVLERF